MLACLFVSACSSSSPAPTATGELEPWQNAAPLPVARANHCIAVVGDTVLVIGGNRKVGADFIKTDETHAGRVATDGTVTWTLAGRTPSPVSECTATADGRRVFLIDGIYDRVTDARQVFTAELADDNTLSPFVPLATMPQIALSSEAVVRRGTLLLMDTVLPAEGDQTVTHRLPLASPTWTMHDWSIGFRAHAQYVFADRFAYTLGGYSGATGNPVMTDVFVAPLGADGAIGAARPTTPLPTPVAFGEAVAVDDFVFVVGGRAQVFGAAATAHVYAAPILDDGALGAWTATALPMARTNHELALVGDFLVSTGGAVMGPGDSTVLVARVRF